MGAMRLQMKELPGTSRAMRSQEEVKKAPCVRRLTMKKGLPQVCRTGRG
jgi:hypothetical protein